MIIATAILAFLMNSLQPEVPAAVPAAAPAKAEPMPAEKPSVIRGAFRTGDRRLVKMRGERTQEADGKATTMPLLTDARIEVLGEREGGWELRITLHAPEDDDVGEAMRAELTRQLAAFGTPMRVRLSGDGEMVLLNLAEVREGGMRAARVAIEAADKAAGRQTDPKIVERAVAATRKMFEDEASANALLLKDYAPLFCHLGYELTHGKLQLFDVEIPSGVSPRMMKGVQTVLIDRRKEGQAILTLRTEPRPEEVRRVLEDMFKLMKDTFVPEKQVEAPDFEGWTLNVLNTVEVTFDEATAWPSMITTESSFTLKTSASNGGKSRRITYTVKEIPADPKP